MIYIRVDRSIDQPVPEVSSMIKKEEHDPDQKFLELAKKGRL
ncbi:hypothetical protein [Thermoactinomyces mirandus]|nr:hypothetical protein [Thermoactinomyces mirandus]